MLVLYDVDVDEVVLCIGCVVCGRMLTNLLWVLYRMWMWLRLLCCYYLFVSVGSLLACNGIQVLLSEF